MSSQPPVTCSVVIATLDRVESLRRVLRCLSAQTCPPLEVIICAAGDAAPVRAAAAEPDGPRGNVQVLTAAAKSSARQRNQAAALARGDVIAFLDDDIEFESDLLQRVLAHFGPGSSVVAASPRFAGTERRPPGAVTRLYYRVQAGYAHPDYGGRLFGPGINCYPILRADGRGFVGTEWLPATCLFVRNAAFRSTLFPEFDGYSYAEDVHLTARLARIGAVGFVSDATILHHSLPSEFKRDVAGLTRGKLRNMSIIAREILGQSAASVWLRLLLHRLFLTVSFAGRRPTNWTSELRGVWSWR